MSTEQFSCDQTHHIHIADPHAEIRLELPVRYTSYWEEGEVWSNAVATLDTQTRVIAETAEEGDDYEHLITQEISLFIQGKLYDFTVCDGLLSEHDSTQLMSALRDSKVILSQTSCALVRDDISNACLNQQDTDSSSANGLVLFQGYWFSLSQLTCFDDSAPKCIPSNWPYMELPGKRFLVAKIHSATNQIHIGLVIGS